MVRPQLCRIHVYMSITFYYIPRTQMTLVFIGNGFVLKGWHSKIEVIGARTCSKYIQMPLVLNHFVQNRKLCFSKKQGNKFGFQKRNQIITQSKAWHSQYRALIHLQWIRQKNRFDRKVDFWPFVFFKFPPTTLFEPKVLAPEPVLAGAAAGATFPPGQKREKRRRRPVGISASILRASTSSSYI